MKKLIVVIPILIFVVMLAFLYAEPETRFWVTKIIGLKNPKIFDENFVIKEIAVGIPSPYQMAKINDDILFLSKNSREIYLIQDNNFIKTPIDVPVSNKEKLHLRGMTSFDSKLFLYYIESKNKMETFENHIFQFDWTGKELSNPKKIEVNHIYTDAFHAGEMVVTPEGSVYVAVGKEIRDAKIENISHPFANYYAYGIHGLEYDTKTGYLWVTEEGIRGKEINVFLPKNYTNAENLEINMQIPFEEGLPTIIPYDTKPVFAWIDGGYPEGIALVSDKWGKGFENSIIVSGCDRGELYKFDLNPNRDGFVIQQSDLTDLSFDQGDSSESILFGENFWCVTDLEFDSNGNLYVVSNQHNGVIYLISPTG